MTARIRMTMAVRAASATRNGLAAGRCRGAFSAKLSVAKLMTKHHCTGKMPKSTSETNENEHCGASGFCGERLICVCLCGFISRCCKQDGWSWVLFCLCFWQQQLRCCCSLLAGG